MRASLLMFALLSPPALAAEEPIPAGFLEYLGEMVQQDGEWVDPLTLIPGDGPDTENPAGSTAADSTVVDEAGGIAGKDEDSDE